MAATADARPRFRQDLVAEALEDGGTRFIDVMDPDSGNLFRFFEVEYSIACGMDGERDVAGIVKWAQDELGVTPSPAEVRSVIATLGDLGFLGAEAIPVATGEPAAAGAAMARIPLKRTPASGVTVNPESVVAPAAAARDPRRDDDLAPGIVVGKAEPVAAKPTPSVELGGAGSTTRPPVSELPAIEDVGLGAAGSTGFIDDGRPAIIEDIALGASGVGDAAPKVEDSIPEPPRDMSLDLSDHIAVRPDDVKEAVRASKVMSAVEVPPELLAALENESPSKPGGDVKAEAAKTDAAKAAQAAEAARAAEATAAKAAAERAVADARAAADAKAAADAAKAKAAAAKAQTTEKVAKPAIELPKQPPPGDAAKLPTAASARTSRALIAVLVLVIAGAAGYAVWRFVLNKSGGGDKRAAVQQPVKPEPPPPPPPKILLVPEPQPPLTVTATIKGNVDKVTANTAVKKGDWIVSLVGHATPEQTIKDLTLQRDKADKDLVTAQANNDPAKATTAQKVKDTLDAKLQAANAELDKYVVRAPVGGALALDAKVKANQMVADNQPIATISPPTLMTAKFPLPPNVQQEPTKVKMKDVTKNDVEVVCSVRLRDQPADTTAPTGSSNQPILNIACPGDGLDAGDEVKFVEVATDDIDMEAGSGVGSAAPAGSAAAGSATGSASVSGGSSSASATPATPAPAAAAPTPTASPTVHQVRPVTAGRVPQNIRASMAASPGSAAPAPSAPSAPATPPPNPANP